MTRCNNCMTIFETNDDGDVIHWTTGGQLDGTELTIQQDTDDSWFTGCPKCKTDSYLMDIPVVDEDYGCVVGQHQDYHSPIFHKE